MRLVDKAIIVTGSTTGIGKAIARVCLREGARVLIHGLEQELGESTRAELDAESARTALVINDLTRPGAPQQVVDHALAAFGQIDGLVNNAGLVSFTSLAETDEAEFDRVIATNTRAPLFLIKAALPHLTKTRGSIVNIGSINSYCGEPRLVSYSISKGGLMTLTRNLGDTLHRENGVRVNQVNPGWVLTENEFQRKKDQGMPDDWPTQQPITVAPCGRLLDPAEIAAAVVYFLSEEAGPISGSVLEVEQYPVLGRNPPKC